MFNGIEALKSIKVLCIYQKNNENYQFTDIMLEYSMSSGGII